jgi:hypothetical protein
VKEAIKELTAQQIRDAQVKEQMNLIMNKILEAAKNFKREVYIRCDYKLFENTIDRIKELGYVVVSNCEEYSIPYKYNYQIMWK